MQARARYLGSAKLIAVCTLLSRVTGLARDIVLNRSFGQNWVQDAFNYGFLIPNLFRRLFGEGALSAIFIPTFTEVLDKEGRPAAWTLLGRVLTIMVLLLSAATIALEAGAFLVYQFFPGGPMRTLQIGLSAVMLPFMVSICVLALLSSLLNCLGHFTTPALLPIVLNLLNMFGVLVVGPMLGDAPEVQIYGVALTVLAASVFQLMLIRPALKSYGVSIRWGIGLKDERVRSMARMFIPVVIGQGVLLFSVFLDSQLCTYLTRGPQDGPNRTFLGVSFDYPLHEGALSAINNAQRLYQFPLGVLAISLATAVFPLFSLYGSREDYAGLRATLGQSLRVAMFEGLPCGVALLLLAEPIVTLLFQYGRYDAAAAARAAWVLKWYALGMPAYCCQHILIRGFYSLKDTLTPMWIGCGLVALNLVINMTLVWHPRIGEAAFGIGTAITSTLHAAVSVWLLRRRMQGRLGGKRIAASLLRTAAACIAAAGVTWAMLDWSQGQDWTAWGRIGQRAMRVFLPLSAAIATYLLAARALRMEELNWLWLGRRGSATDASEVPLK